MHDGFAVKSVLLHKSQLSEFARKAVYCIGSVSSLLSTQNFSSFYAVMFMHPAMQNIFRGRLVLNAPFVPGEEVCSGT